MVSSYDFFTEIVKGAFLGGKHVIDTKPYTLEPTLLRRYDLLRKSPEFGSKAGMNYLFSNLPQDFTSTAKSELYRKAGGWLDKGYDERKVKQFQIDKDIFLVPILSKPAVGIDTSSNDEDTFVCFAFFDNYKAAYHYFDKFLQVPKSKTSRPEFKWNKLDTECRSVLDQNLEYILGMSCEFLLLIRTNALKFQDEKLVDIFIKLIDGCFSNYEHKLESRLKLKNKLFKLSNDTPIHCDADFSPLTPDKIIKQFVKILSDGNEHTALHAEKDSHESEPIQVADILCGILKECILNKKRDNLVSWEFNNKLKSETKEKYAKCYYWERKEISPD